MINQTYHGIYLYARDGEPLNRWAHAGDCDAGLYEQVEDAEAEALAMTREGFKCAVFPRVVFDDEQVILMRNGEES